MSKKREIDDADLTEIAGAEELRAGSNVPPTIWPIPRPSYGSAARAPETDDQGGDNQNFGE